MWPALGRSAAEAAHLREVIADQAREIEAQRRELAALRQGLQAAQREAAQSGEVIRLLSEALPGTVARFTLAALGFAPPR